LASRQIHEQARTTESPQERGRKAGSGLWSGNPMETLSEYNLNLSEARPGIVAHDQYIGDGESQILPAKMAYLVNR
jgi:hypothetical protein